MIKPDYDQIWFSIIIAFFWTSTLKFSHGDIVVITNGWWCASVNSGTNYIDLNSAWTWIFDFLKRRGQHKTVANCNFSISKSIYRNGKIGLVNIVGSKVCTCIGVALPFEEHIKVRATQKIILLLEQTYQPYEPYG